MDNLKLTIIYDCFLGVAAVMTSGINKPMRRGRAVRSIFFMAPLRCATKKDATAIANATYG